MSPSLFSFLGRALDRGVWLIAAVYFYFLIFAQFAFLRLLKQQWDGVEPLQWILGIMAAGGVVGSLAVPLFARRFGLGPLLRVGLLTASGVAAAAILVQRTSWWCVVSFGIGASVGLSTVSLVTRLADLLGPRNWGWRIGGGVGIAYALCNVPWIFQASPQGQALLAAIATVLAAMVVPNANNARSSQVSSEFVQTAMAFSLPTALISFAILVWFDSAVFYMIQNNAAYAKGTWHGTGALWRNAAVHASMALAAGGLLQRVHSRAGLMASLVMLALAAWWVRDASTRTLAGWMYPAGVSIYSVCLVAYPAYLSGAVEVRSRAIQAATLYSVSGWMASALGIGMATNLHGVPIWFILGAGLVVLATHAKSFWRPYGREWAAAAVVVLAAWTAHGLLREGPPGHTTFRVERGREVYLSEGCIHCHSQYVRPGSVDVVRWGPEISPEALHTNLPPLYGNRRQGPDLLQVGNRRSRHWLKQHFLDPRAVRPGSVMPAYAHLFEDERGEALLDYLTSLGHGTLVERMSQTRAWTPSAKETRSWYDPKGGRDLFSKHCSGCHGVAGQGHAPLASAFPRAIGPLAQGRFVFAPANLAPETRLELLARIIKFGAPGTHMPGHEFLSDSDIATLAGYVASWTSP